MSATAVLMEAPVDRDALVDVSNLASYLCTPQAWQEMAIREAFDLIGTNEGAQKLAESRRYAMCATRIAALKEELAYAVRVSNELRAVIQKTVEAKGRPRLPRQEAS